MEAAAVVSSLHGNNDNPELLHGEITGLTIAAMYDVHSELGFGFLELVYKNALAVALRELGLRAWTKMCAMKSTITGSSSAATLLILSSSQRSMWRRRLLDRSTPRISNRRSTTRRRRSWKLCDQLRAHAAIQESGLLERASGEGRCSAETLGRPGTAFRFSGKAHAPISAAAAPPTHEAEHRQWTAELRRQRHAAAARSSGCRASGSRDSSAALLTAPASDQPRSTCP